MGREIRRVPPNWEHPRYTEDDCPHNREVGDYRPCHDEDYKSAAAEWWRQCDLWQRGEHPDRSDEYRYYWEYAGGPPIEEYYRPEFTEDPTWFQVYQTVSKGTPVSPPFATEEELARYLYENGDFWYQESISRGMSDSKPESYEDALAFVQAGHAFSLMVRNEAGKVDVQGPYEQHTHKRS